MSYSFKNLKVSEVEKRWLKEIASAEFSEINFNLLKVKFRDALKAGFDPDQIDQRLIQDGRLTLIGYWYLDPKHEIFNQVTVSIKIVRGLIIQNSNQRLISASTISNELSTDLNRGEMILGLIYDLPGFFGGGRGADQNKYGMKQAKFHNDNKAFDKFLKFQNLDENLEEFYLNRSKVGTTRGHTDWPKVNRQLQKARELLFQAYSVEDYQNVGLCCREALISLAQEVYDENLHDTDGGIEPSDTDSKRMLNAFITEELGGSSNKLFRKLVKSAHDVANATQHKRTADYTHASLCVEGTVSLVEMIRIIHPE